MTAITMTDEMIAHRMSKVGNINSATRSKCIEIIKAAAAAGHDIWFTWGCGDGEHSCPPGLALDLMVKNEAAGDWVRNYIWVNRARLRLRHVIWEQHITSTVVSPGVRRFMADRGNSTVNHYDHNHVLFLSGDYVAPAGATKPSTGTTKPPAKDDSLLERGSTGDRVGYLQAGLKRVFPSYAGRLAVDKSFGPATEKAVMEFQRRSGLVVDGKVGPGTRRELEKHGIDTFKPPTKTSASTSSKPKVPAYPGHPHSRVRADDSHVKMIQQRLKDRGWNVKVDGQFGYGLDRVVRQFQKEKGLKNDGIVGPATWKALWALPIT